MKVLVGTFKKEKVLVGAFSGHCYFREGSLSALPWKDYAGVSLGLQQVVAEVHDHEPGEGVEQPAADHAQLVVVQPQLLQPRHRREQRRGQRHDAVTCNI